MLCGGGRGGSPTDVSCPPTGRRANDQRRLLSPLRRRDCRLQPVRQVRLGDVDDLVNLGRPRRVDPHAPDHPRRGGRAADPLHTRDDPAPGISHCRSRQRQNNQRGSRAARRSQSGSGMGLNAATPLRTHCGRRRPGRLRGGKRRGGIRAGRAAAGTGSAQRIEARLKDALWHSAYPGNPGVVMSEPSEGSDGRASVAFATSSRFYLCE